MPITRRTVVLGISAVFGVSPTRSFAGDDVAITAIENRHGGRLGVFAVDISSGRTLSYRADERFLMCSTFKGLLAAQVLSRVDSGADSLTRLVPYGKKDLVFTSPITKANVAKGALSVAALCQAIV